MTDGLLTHLNTLVPMTLHWTQLAWPLGSLKGPPLPGVAGSARTWQRRAQYWCRGSDRRVSESNRLSVAANASRAADSRFSASSSFLSQQQVLSNEAKS